MTTRWLHGSNNVRLPTEEEYLGIPQRVRFIQRRQLERVGPTQANNNNYLGLLAI